MPSHLGSDESLNTVYFCSASPGRHRSTQALVVELVPLRKAGDLFNFGFRVTPRFPGSSDFALEWPLVPKKSDRPVSQKRNNPWQTREIRVIYDNPWVRLEEHDAINPAGKPCIYGKVCFHNQAVGILPLDDHGNTWLVGQHRYALDAWSWEIPEGGSPAGEDPLETARRELKEETGLSARRFELFCTMHLSNSVTDEEGFVYLAMGLEDGETMFEETEDIVVRKLPVEEAIRMAMAGEITDAMSLTALFRYAVVKGIAP